jgi:hypothetical protein
VRGIAESPDGTSVTTSASGRAVAAFDRVPATGAPARKAGRDACTSPDGSGGACRAGAGITGAADLALAPDGAQVSTAAFVGDAIGVLDRRQAPLCARAPRRSGTAGRRSSRSRASRAARP